MICGDRLLLALDLFDFLAEGSGPTNSAAANTRGFSIANAVFLVRNLCGECEPLDLRRYRESGLPAVRRFLRASVDDSLNFPGSAGYLRQVVYFPTAALFTNEVEDALGTNAYTVWRKMIAACASGAITEEMLKDPVEAPAVPTGQGPAVATT